MPGLKRTTSGVLGGILGLVGLSAVAGILVTATVTPAIAVSGYAASSALTLFDNLPNDLRVDRPMEPTTIYAKNEDGSDFVLTTFYDQNRIPLEYDEVSTTMYDAILASEDRRYFEHGGIDLLGTTRALLSNASGASTQGGSSITQQYVKNVLVQRCEQEAAYGSDEQNDCFNAVTNAEGPEGYERKLQEIRYAVQLEQNYSKEDILVGYLNLANFGGSTYGIEAAAQRYFDTSANDLTIAQAATLAGIVQNPNLFRIDLAEGTRTNADGEGVNSEADGYSLTQERKQYVLTEMHNAGWISDDEYDEAWNAPIEPNITSPKTGCQAAGGSAYFCKYVQETILNDPAFGETEEERYETLRRGGLDVYTTLDFRVQMPAEATMTAHAATHIDGMDFGAAIATIEPSTGRILAIAQNTKFSEDQAQIDSEPGYSSLVYAGDRAHGGAIGFSAGSTYKLFTLVDWLENGRSINEVLNGVKRRFNWSCDGQTYAGEYAIENFNNANGYTGTVAKFTADSLNSGFLAMAEQLDVCEINRVAERFGVAYGDGTPVTANDPSTNHVQVQYDVLGSKNIPPIEIASAFATIANNGVRCTPHAIDKILDADGNELEVPEAGCEKVVEPNIAATAAAALAGVMNGGTGAQGNPGDGTPLIGKTGTHERLQTWLVESSTGAATVAWAGNAQGTGDVFTNYSNGTAINNLRYVLSRDTQAAANAVYPGTAFPQPDPNLTRRILVDLPDVTGMSIAEATSTLEGAGFQVAVGDSVPGDQPEGTVQSQDPGAGQAARGSLVTLFPSDGKATSVPDVSGLSVRAAYSALIGAGFTNVARGSCSESDGAGSGTATSTDPAAGSIADPDTEVRVNYEAEDCG